jgi:hypothetical protein
VEKMLEAVPSSRLPKREFVELLGSPQGWKIEEALKAELYKVLKPELPNVNLADLISDLATVVAKRNRAVRPLVLTRLARPEIMA